MSINLHVEAVAQADVVGGRRIKITDKFGLWQTPTTVTNAIMQHSDTAAIIEEYRKFCESVCEPCDEPIYDYNGALDSNFEYPLIGTKRVYPAQEHISELLEWIAARELEGYSIEFSAW